jgi:hypothetical protein
VTSRDVNVIFPILCCVIGPRLHSSPPIPSRLSSLLYGRLLERRAGGARRTDGKRTKPGGVRLRWWAGEALQEHARRRAAARVPDAGVAHRLEKFIHRHCRSMSRWRVAASGRSRAGDGSGGGPEEPLQERAWRRAAAREWSPRRRRGPPPQDLLLLRQWG